MDKRIFFLVAAALVIMGLCVFKVSRTQPPRHSTAAREISEPAPPFELYDQSSPSRLVRLASYLGRHRVIVVFFDGRAGADHSPVLQRLREQWKALHNAGMYVMAISAAIPQENRKIIAKHGEFPFPLLSDPGLDVHRTWGRYDAAGHAPLEGVFFVDRKGEVAWSRATNKPEPVHNWEARLIAFEEGRVE